MISLAARPAASHAATVTPQARSLEGKGILRHARRRLLAAVVAIGLGIVLAGSLATPASALESGAVHDASFVDRVNTLRAQRGLPALTVNGELSNVARTWSVRMASSGTLAHNRALTSQVQNWQKVGENVAYGLEVSPIFKGLVGSPTHLRNMLDSAYTMIGVGTVIDRTGLLWTTHVFMRPMASGAAAAAPTTVAAKAPAVPAKASLPSPLPAAPAAPAGSSTAPAPGAPTTVAPPVIGTPLALVNAMSAEPTSADGSATTAAADEAAAPTSSGRRIIGPLLAGAVLLLLVVGGTVLLLRRSFTRAENLAPAPGPAW